MSIRNKLLDNRRELGLLSSGQMELVFLPLLACGAGSGRRESPFSQISLHLPSTYPDLRIHSY